MMEEWKTERLENLTEVKGGKRLPKGEKLIEIPTPFPYIRVSDFENYSVNISEIKFLSPDIRETIKRYIINDDDVYISIAGTIGMVGIIPRELDGANLTENAARLVIKDRFKLDKEYLKFYLSEGKINANIQSRKSKNAQPKLSLANIKSLEISYPPLPEQRKIAYVLGTVQKAIEKQDHLIKTTTELKKALMQKLFTEGLYGESQKMTEIGLVPESWEVVELNDICERVTINVEPQVNGKTPYVGLEHINPGRSRLNNWGHESEVVSSKAKFNEGEILYGKLRPYLDKAVVAHFDGICSTDILVFNGKNGVGNDFLIHFFHTEKLLGFANSTTTGVQHPRTSWNSLKKLIIGLPKREERNEIANILTTVVDKIEFHEKKKQTLTDLFKTLLHELMTGQRRVNDLEIEGIKD